MVKRSVSLDEDVVRRIEGAAREQGLSFSAWLSATADRQLRIQDGLRAMAEWDAEDPLTPEERAQARTTLDGLLYGDVDA